MGGPGSGRQKGVGLKRLSTIRSGRKAVTQKTMFGPMKMRKTRSMSKATNLRFAGQRIRHLKSKYPRSKAFSRADYLRGRSF